MVDETATVYFEYFPQDTKPAPPQVENRCCREYDELGIQCSAALPDFSNRRLGRSKRSQWWCTNAAGCDPLHLRFLWSPRRSSLTQRVELSRMGTTIAVASMKLPTLMAHKKRSNTLRTRINSLTRTYFKEMVDRNGNRKVYSYDAHGRKIGCEIFPPVGVVAVKVESWSYLSGTNNALGGYC